MQRRDVANSPVDCCFRACEVCSVPKDALICYTDRRLTYWMRQEMYYISAHREWIELTEDRLLTQPEGHNVTEWYLNGKYYFQKYILE